MRKGAFLVAFGAALVAGPALAKEKPGQVKEKKVCRTVQMSGRITPQKICRKVELRAAEQESQRPPRQPGESGNRAN
ncbi:MAG TPA: hypothetical protein VF620_00970 [Allosphingosinicella sp.]